jgi:hypothetical protein
MSSTMRSSCCELVAAVCSICRWSLPSWPRAIRSSIGRMPLSGVRISWLIVARNSPLASAAASAACLALSSSCSSWFCCCRRC